MSEPAAQPDFRPFVGRNELAKLEYALSDGNWHRAATLASQGINDRLARAIAEEKPGLFITGNLGYKLTAFASVAEIEASAKRLASQAAKMQARADILFSIAAERERAAAAA
jgi:hypothetical protein